MLGYVRIETDGDCKIESFYDLYHPDKELVDMELSDIIDELIESAVEDGGLLPDSEYLVVFKHYFETTTDYEGGKDYDSWVEIINIIKLADSKGISSINNTIIKWHSEVNLGVDLFEREE